MLFVLLLLTSYFWLYEAKLFSGRATTLQNPVSLENSYIFVSPLKAVANNQELIRITAFILNNQGLGVNGKKVTIQSDPALTIQAVQGVTDGFGKAVFDISSIKAGEYYLEITVDTKKLNQKAHLSFY